MDEKQRFDALETALQNELNEREFYLKHASRTNNAIGRSMFLRIADDELEHYQRLKELHAAWKRKDKWPDTVPLTVKTTNILSVLKELIRKAGESPEADRDDLEAIRIAADFETKGNEAYLALSKSVTDNKEKAFFELLASMEREHYLSLKDAEEYFKDPASWFTRKEHHGLDGA
ncbi:MAG TPA: ferritin family protein [Desulfomonilia bacterium]|nr:ferritin family protein [Desulfomonilia bacterium]